MGAQGGKGTLQKVHDHVLEYIGKSKGSSMQESSGNSRGLKGLEGFEREVIKGSKRFEKVFARF
jgi:hypothetical protein